MRIPDARAHEVLTNRDRRTTPSRTRAPRYESAAGAAQNFISAVYAGSCRLHSSSHLSEFLRRLSNQDAGLQTAFGLHTFCRDAGLQTCRRQTLVAQVFNLPTSTLVAHIFKPADVDPRSADL